jgi:hypothetical protein
MRQALAVFFLAVSCYAGEAVWPKWSRQLVENLRCGMSVEQIERLTREEIIVESGDRSWLGRHRISRRHTDLWLQFREDRTLVSYILARADSPKTTILSPKRNLCTGEITFQLRLLVASDFLGAAVRLNGQPFATIENIQEDFELPLGRHELLIEKEGYAPIRKRLCLELTSRGDHRFDLRGAAQHRPGAEPDLQLRRPPRRAARPSSPSTAIPRRSCILEA